MAALETPPNPYRAFVAAIAEGVAGASALPKGGLPALQLPPVEDDAPVALVLAPHPDDECITGALPLRLRREAGYRVIDVAVTLGSNRARRAGRLAELRGACAYLGFELSLPAPEGLERVTATTRASDPAHWRTAVDALAAVIAAAQPSVVFLPHDADWNGTHIGTHFLGVDALAAAGIGSPLVVETEFWGAMADPNLMVESSVDDVAALAAATAFHAGEVERNPYHLRLPAWMQDNVRRGGELVGGQGSIVPTFAFATLYRLGRFRGGQIEPPPSGSARWLAAGNDPRGLLR